MFAASKTNSASTGGYQISRSLRFNQPDSTYLARTPASAGSRTTWTLSGWFKGFKSNLNNVIYCAGSGANQTGIYVDSANQQLNFYEIQSSSAIGNLVTTQVFRDISAWYHIVAVYDSTQATASSRMRLYVNGTQVTAFGTATYVSQNTNSIANSAVITEFGNGSGNAAFYEGLMTELNFIDGQALTPSSFGETNAQTGVWQPKAYSGSYGTNGFYLNFSDNSNTTAATLGKDYSGNGNNWTPNNFSVTAGVGNDSLVDTPTPYGVDTGIGGSVGGNYCTLNSVSNVSGQYTISNGNLQIVSSNAYNSFVTATFNLPSSGKWYYEYLCTNTSGANLRDSVGFAKNGIAQTYLGDNSNTLGYNGQYGGLNGFASGSYSTWTNGDVIGFAIDCDTGKVWISKNNTWQNSGSPTGGTGQVATLTDITNWIPSVSAYSNSASSFTVNGTLNFGQRTFAYTAPSGFKALCTQNLPTPTIGATTATQAGKFFNPVLYTGNGSARSITGVGFQPDFTWIKLRDTNSSNGLFDAVRGATKRLVSDTTAAEDTISGVTSFDSDGFSLGTSYNGSSFLYVAWNWKANGSGSTNTAGSITSTVSANTTSGFSVVTYTGNGNVGSNGTIGHGLGVVPSMFIIKRRDNTGFWYVATRDGGTATAPTYSLFTRGSSGLNDTGAAFTRNANYASSGYITSSILDLYWLSAAVTAGDAYDINFLTGTYVAYCFAEVAGYSKFGSYTGNGSADGPFVFTGMRPAYVMVKRTDTGGANMNWIIWDATRNTRNVVGEEIYANLNDAGTTYTDLDFLSNGFKIRNSTTWYNASGGTYIYMAFAQNPFKYSLAR